MKQARLLKTMDVFATRPEFPFGGTTTKASAFLIQRPGNKPNVWVYSSSHVGDYVDHVAELGGVSHQLLNHRDEASKCSNVLAAPVFCHALEQEAIESKGAAVGEKYQGSQHTLSLEGDGDLVVAYHTPGHTPGVTTYYYRNEQGQTLLFTGDTLYINEQGKFASGPLSFYAYPGNQEDMIQTLTFYLEIHPTYIICGLTMSDSFCSEFDPDQIRGLIQDLKHM